MAQKLSQWQADSGSLTKYSSTLQQRQKPQFCIAPCLDHEQEQSSKKWFKPQFWAVRGLPSLQSNLQQHQGRFNLITVLCGSLWEQLIVGTLCMVAQPPPVSSTLTWAPAYPLCWWQHTVYNSHRTPSTMGYWMAIHVSFLSLLLEQRKAELGWKGENQTWHHPCTYLGASSSQSRTSLLRDAHRGNLYLNNPGTLSQPHHSSSQARATRLSGKILHWLSLA